MNRVVHFEIHADNPERAVEFYSKVFGWEIKFWEGGQMEYWMIVTGKQDEPGISGGLMRRKGSAPAEGQALNSFVSTIVCEDYDGYAKKIADHGGKEVVPKAALVGMAWQGYFKDTEGNIFGLHQADPNAK